MSKKNTGLLIAFGAALGAAAACVSYYLKYKSFSDELDKDFHDYEDEDESASQEIEKETVPVSDSTKRNYITIDSCKYKSQEQNNLDESTEEPVCTASDAPKADEKAPGNQQTAESPSADVTVEEDTEGTEE